MGFKSGFKGLKLFLRLSNCASVGEKKIFDNYQDTRYVREHFFMSCCVNLDEPAAYIFRLEEKAHQNNINIG